MTKKYWAGREFDYMQLVGDAIRKKGFTHKQAEDMMRRVKGEIVDLYYCGASVDAAVEHVGLSRG